ncbi:3-keto-disaccharide hydrolase [Algoriphagus namhaensis]
MKGLLTKWLILELIGVGVVLLLLVWNGYFDSKEKKVGSVAASFEPVESNDFQSIFDGETLRGWEGDDAIWSVENGVIVGEIAEGQGLETNTFLIYEKPVADFELRLEFKISASGNSGVQYRSERIDGSPFALRGYQADIDGKNTYTGQNYEEKKRTTLAYRGQKTRITSQPDEVTTLRDFVEKNAWKGLNLESDLGDRAALGAKIKSEDWNEMHLVIQDNVLKHYVNGILMSEVTDADSKNRSLSGLLGLQVHVGPPMKVEFRDIRLKNL